MLLVQVQYFENGTRYGLEILRKCGKGIKTKSQKVFEANSCDFRSYMKKTGRGTFCTTPPIPPLSILTGAQEPRDNQFLFQNVQTNEIFEIFKMFKNIRWINVYYTKSKRL